VAPGGAREATLASACTSFHWGRGESAETYELVVYEVGAEGGTTSSMPAEPALTARVPGSALSWTPGLEHCLQPGLSYGWSVRALEAEGPSAWAPPLFFAVPKAPTVEELSHAIEILQRHELAGERVPTRDANEVVAYENGEPRASPRDLGIIEPPGPPDYAGGGPAALKVVGEVRTVDPSSQEPRLWGRGRPGTKVYGKDDGSDDFCTNGPIQFGLSEAAVNWGAAADACPSGTWVCEKGEIEAAPACDTARPDHATTDGLFCNGDDLGFLEDRHQGWLADHWFTVVGWILWEGTDDFLGLRTCYSLPVWCCFQ
jgi:hypothetical protein